MRYLSELRRRNDDSENLETFRIRNTAGDTVKILLRPEYLPAMLQRFYYTRNTENPDIPWERMNLIFTDSVRFNTQAARDYRTARTDAFFLYHPDTCGNPYVCWILKGRGNTRMACKSKNRTGRVSDLFCSSEECRTDAGCFNFGNSIDAREYNRYEFCDLYMCLRLIAYHIASICLIALYLLFLLDLPSI